MTILQENRIDFFRSMIRRSPIASPGGFDRCIRREVHVFLRHRHEPIVRHWNLFGQRPTEVETACDPALRGEVILVFPFIIRHPQLDATQRNPADDALR